MELLFIVDGCGPVAFDSGHADRFWLVAGVFMELVLMGIDWDLLCPKLAEVHLSSLPCSHWGSIVLTVVNDVRIADTHRSVIGVDLGLDPVDHNSLLWDDQRSWGPWLGFWPSYSLRP